MIDRDAMHEAADELAEIQRQMAELCYQAGRLLRGLDVGGSCVVRRAEAYWLGHMISALGEGEGTHSTTMLDTARELEALADDDGEAAA